MSRGKTPEYAIAAGALALLAIFQREGRLVDFLSEEIDAYDDASIGAAVRDIHKGCKKVLREHFGVEPVIAGDEDEVAAAEHHVVEMLGSGLAASADQLGEARRADVSA
jgi:hypothetical protein